MNTSQCFSPAMKAITLALALLTSAQAGASEIATNMRLSFSEVADFSQGLDQLLSFDAATANFRLQNDRLGTFSSGSMTLTLNGQQLISINDPGVSVLPDTQRNLLRVEASATASGGLLDAPQTLGLSTTWFCNNTVLVCNTDEAYSQVKSITPDMNTPASAAALLQPVRLQASASLTPLTEGVSINSGALYLYGNLQINATFTAKTTSQYINDALFATTGAGSGVAAARWAAAAADVQLVRNGSYTDIAVSSPLQARKTAELEAAQRLLTAARDSATLLTTGATDTSYNSRFALTRQLWDMAATADPSLGKSLASHPSDALTSTDLAAEVAVLKMLLNGVQDTDFTTQLDSLLAQPMVTGPTALLTFDGALLGLNNALLSIYYLGNASSGTIEIDLLAADRYAFFRNSYDRASLLEGSANGLTVIGNDGYAGTQLTLDSGEMYIGEIYNGLLQLSGNQTAAKLQLNNFYTNQLFVVASFGTSPSPVPEPNAALLLSGGWLLLSRMRKRLQQSS